jgi:hypothetical protein
MQSVTEGLKLLSVKSIDQAYLPSKEVTSVDHAKH